MAKQTKRAKVLNLVEKMRKADPNVKPGDVVAKIESTAKLGTAAARTYYYHAIGQLGSAKKRKRSTAHKAA